MRFTNKTPEKAHLSVRERGEKKSSTLERFLFQGHPMELCHWIRRQSGMPQAGFASLESFSLCFGAAISSLTHLIYHCANMKTIKAKVRIKQKERELKRITETPRETSHQLLREKNEVVGRKQLTGKIKRQSQTWRTDRMSRQVNHRMKPSGVMMRKADKGRDSQEGKF